MAGLWLSEASAESWLTILLGEIACGEVEFIIPADGAHALDGIRDDVFFEREVDGQLLVLCDWRIWRQARRILDRYGVSFVFVEVIWYEP
jgi:uncharacterized protein (UPF0261 family)